MCVFSALEIGGNIDHPLLCLETCSVILHKASALSAKGNWTCNSQINAHWISVVAGEPFLRAVTIVLLHFGFEGMRSKRSLVHGKILQVRMKT